MNCKHLSSLFSRIHQGLTLIPYLLQSFRLVWDSAQKWTIAWMILLVIQGLLPMAIVLLTKNLINLLAESIGSLESWQPFAPILTQAALLGAALLANTMLSSLAAWVRANQAERVQDHVHKLIHEQALHLDLAYYETPEYYDQLYRAQIDAANQPVSLLENVGSLMQNCITLLAMGGILITYAWWLLPVLLISTLPVLWVASQSVWKFHRWRIINTINERRARHYDWIITWHNAAAELRLFDLGIHFRNAFQTLRHQLRSEKLLLTRQQMFGEISAGIFSLAAMAATMLWLVWRTYQGMYSLGDLALFYQIFNQGQLVMGTLLKNLGAIYRSVLFLENLFEFINLQPSLADPNSPRQMPALPADICFKHVTFYYPGSEKPALANFNLTIPAGKITAIVGENGAGKSTLIKLICRFYDPNIGNVTLGGIDLCSLKQSDLRREISVLFQEPMHYDDTAANNIAYGDFASNPQQATIELAARNAGADQPILNLPHGYQTRLGKWFGGSELSVGEWQRVALARAFLRLANIIILDEPTSAMDAWAEADWMSRFRSLSTGRTTLIITHRFTTAMQADIIHVMKAGKIIETGTHETLISLDGHYAKSWKKQMQRQENEPESNILYSQE